MSVNILVNLDNEKEFFGLILKKGDYYGNYNREIFFSTGNATGLDATITGSGHYTEIQIATLEKNIWYTQRYTKYDGFLADELLRRENLKLDDLRRRAGRTPLRARDRLVTRYG